MNVSTFAKAADKIIDRMSPEELARYACDQANSQAKKISSGEITREEVDQQIEIFTKKHLIFRDGGQHVRYLQALCKESNKHVMKELGEEYIGHLNAEIRASKLTVVSVRLANLLWCAMSRHTTDTEILAPLKTTLDDLDGSVGEHLKKIDELERAKAKFLSYPGVVELGTLSDVVERESLLPESPLFNNGNNFQENIQKIQTRAGDASTNS